MASFVSPKWYFEIMYLYLWFMSFFQRLSFLPIKYAFPIDNDSITRISGIQVLWKKKGRWKNVKLLIHENKLWRKTVFSTEVWPILKSKFKSLPPTVKIIGFVGSSAITAGVARTLISSSCRAENCIFTLYSHTNSLQHVCK